MNELSPQEIEAIDGVLLALMRGRAYQQWRRDQYIRAALTAVLAHGTVSYRRVMQDGQQCDVVYMGVAELAVQHADDAIAAADRDAQS